MQFSSVWALYVALSNLILPLYTLTYIRPFTTNNALSGPSLHRDSALFPVLPRSGGSGVVCVGSVCAVKYKVADGGRIEHSYKKRYFSRGLWKFA